MSDEDHPRDSEGDGERSDPTVGDTDRPGDADEERDRSVPTNDEGDRSIPADDEGDRSVPADDEGDRSIPANDGTETGDAETETDDAETETGEAETETGDAEADHSAEVSEAQAWAEPDHDSTDEGVLDPEELDISKRDGVETTDEGQFVISTGQSGIDPDVPAVRVIDSDTNSDEETEHGNATDRGESVSGATGDAVDTSGDTGDAQQRNDSRANEPAADDPLSVVETDLAALSSQHAAAVVARDGQTTGSIQTASNSRPAVLEAVLRWYASRVDDEAPPDETLRRLLAATALDLGVDDHDRNE